MKPYESRVALVTGASRGLGAHIAHRLAELGCAVAVTARSADDLRLVAKRINEDTGRQTLVVPGDLRSREDRVGIVDQVESSMGSIDILANVAGIGAAEEFHSFDGSDVLVTNLEAPIDLTRRVVPRMREREFGRILNIASIAGAVGLPYLADYCASKAGLIGFSVSLREELRGTGVSVTVASPGFMVDEGMYVPYQTPAPWYFGSNKSRKVARRAVNALVKQRSHAVVNRLPMRPMMTMNAVSEPMMRFVTRSLGATTFMRGLSEVDVTDAAVDEP